MKCVCIGGGILGLEIAGALARRGVDVTVLEDFATLMPRQLNRKAALLMQDYVASIGLNLKLMARTQEITGDRNVRSVLLTGGEQIPADLVIIATGVRSNTHLARRAGLAVNNGILVDNLLHSSHPDILAAGDVAEHQGLMYGSWAAAQYQGRIAGMNAAGLNVEFGGIPRAHTLKVLGLDMTSIGKFQPEDGSYQVIEQESDGCYQGFIFRDGRMVGTILLGETHLAGVVKQAIENRQDFSGMLVGGLEPEPLIAALARGKI